ncbi:hypothetical protein CH373_12505 [Leptospira perolatii]|uniref:phosphoribosylglycinamide formyltransferase 1 n=1 Tax=Leptospira perolatii TaxID=2023191 RepID=A0A2M9ZLQ3_9LEPT|nr:formyltransferase family protein [Leptospira perolatii]PJZ70243.1 hypothetical protein CH360_06465 [Leptospira perolatii]PJZ72873.1 hypothetical protein CH373_12505 [Leptospira perolatii]
MKILFVGKANDKYAEQAARYLKQIFPDSLVVFGLRGEKMPEFFETWQGDYVFSYLSPWIIPARLLQSAAKGAINWHPGSPEYPGIGCTNFAIYNGETEFGITCHYMNPAVDTGKIVEVKRFPILENDTVFSITEKCYALIINSFFRIVERIANHLILPESDEKWQRKPFTRKELDALCEIKPDMSAEEVEKRIKATTYDKPWAYTIIQGKKFYWIGK